MPLVEELIDVSVCLYSKKNFEVPDFPMQFLAVDLFFFQGKDYLVTVDRYSRWPDCFPLSQTKSFDVIRILRKLFADFWRP